MRTSHARRALTEAQECACSWSSVGERGLESGIPGPRSAL